ncbi:MAG: CpsB/CapC family capsule biosynthesis tyrosine phosphatase [Schaedlerella sp.]|nr:CpsB/CapC family capsule biosynthesis tyrosine phosphatase [Schaedlerella sp.]
MRENFKGMTDIHMHLIPGVDDGAWSLEMAMAMIDMAYRQGIRKIIATPHSSAFVWDWEFVKVNYQILREEVQKNYSEITLYFGCEVNCGTYDMGGILDSLAKGWFPSLNGTKYVLIDFHPLIETDEVVECAEQLLEDGWFPILAHLERYRNVNPEDVKIQKLKEKGCKIQINAYSLQEEDISIKERARLLIKNKSVDFLGTDAHRTIHRPPMAKSGLQYLYEHFDNEYVDDIVYRNAEKYLLIK